MNDSLNLAYEVTMKEYAEARRIKKQSEARLAGREGTVHPYNSLVSKLLMETKNVLKNRLRKKKGRSVVGVLALRCALKQKGVNLDRVCAIAARTVVDGVSNQHRVQTISQRIGSRIEDEIRMREFKRREPQLFKRMGDKFKEQGSRDYRHKRGVLIAALGRANSSEEWETWDVKTKASVGLLLIDSIVETGYMETVRVMTAKKGQFQIHIKLTDETEAALSLMDARAHELLQPRFKPMLVVPRDWTNPVDGGYVSLPMTIMKTHQRQDIERLRAAEMPVIYAAINAVQRTPWRINEDVLVTAEQLRLAGSTIKGLPVLGHLSNPGRPDLPPLGTVLTEAESAVLLEYKKEKRIWYDDEIRRGSKTTQCLQIMDVANEMRYEETIYFPHQMDYRGRLYAVPLQLNPQGNDLSKGLLTFATGRPLGTMGAFWLAFHGANTWGKDKGPLADRVDWTFANEDMILRSAEDPLSCQWWSDADGGSSPWQFLAFCLEWKRYVDAGSEPDFISFLPVSVDGACNGLQHFSALLRDPVGALATNLTISKKQYDIYEQVATVTSRLAQESRHKSEKDRELAGIWKEFGITRSVVKRPVMTTPYGCTAIGMKQMVIDDTINADKTGAYFGDRSWVAAQWLSYHIYKAIGETVSAAQGAMVFLRKLAVITSDRDLPISWTTAAGLPVVQRILSASSFRIDTTLLGSVNLRYDDALETLDRRKQRSAITPNFIHAADGAHLQLTVVATEAKLERPLSWAMIHDSYGTHAGDLTVVGGILREQFVAMYRHADPLGDMRERVLEAVAEDVEVPEAPAIGTFDIEDVLKAEFFFS